MLKSSSTTPAIFREEGDVLNTQKLHWQSNPGLPRSQRCASCPRARCANTVSPYSLAWYWQLLDRHHTPFAVWQRKIWESTDTLRTPLRASRLTSSREQASGSLTAAFSGDSTMFCAKTGMHCLHQCCCCTQTSWSSRREGVEADLVFNLLLICLWKPAGFRVTWCTGYSAIFHSYDN